MSKTVGLRSLNPAQRRVFMACFLGWTLDAFDFFILTYCLDSVAAAFHVGLVSAADAFFWTLCMRPVGALLFGWMAERWGRRPTLMLNIVCFSIFELATAFAPSFGVFLATRALFGVAMGGEWGVGAALAFETLPAEGRGFFSGLLQEGYVVGNLLAAAVYGLLFPHLHGHGLLVNWRVLFMVGSLPSLAVLWVLAGVGESPAWLAKQRLGAKAASQRTGETLRQRTGETLSAIGRYLPSFFFLTLMMTAFMSFSHGTQDLYPTFLKHDHGLSVKTTSWVAIVGYVGGVLGGVLCGTLSERLGRRRVMVAAALLAIPVIPLWAWSPTAALLACGGFLMQFMVQGAWGIIPVHLNELSPAPVRAIFPGLAYQMGNVLSSENGPLQAWLAKHFYGGRLTPVLAWTVLVVALAVALMSGIGREAKGADLSTV
jgi:SHS family lactate transporter-like MFS transporter